jgi:GT2 family glycosyltransferase
MEREIVDRNREKSETRKSSDAGELDVETDENPPRVTAVVLNWNSYDDTNNCIDSLLEQSYENLHVVVVDNGSTDGSAKQIGSEFPSIDLVRTGENLGFGGGMNTGIDRALESRSEYVWIVNNDTLYPDKDILKTLVRTVEQRETIGIVTPLIRKYPNTEETYFERGFIDERSYNAGLHRGTRSILDLRFGKEPVEAYTDGPLVWNDFIPLCCALVRKQVIEDVGPIPEEYFLYYEDADYGARINDTGYELVTHRGVEAYHRSAASSESSVLPEYYKARNRFLFARKRGTVDVGFLLVFLWRLLAGATYKFAKGDVAVAYALFRGAFHGWQGKTGRGPYP